jgi:hypothetical protein
MSDWWLAFLTGFVPAALAAVLGWVKWLHELREKRIEKAGRNEAEAAHHLKEASHQGKPDQRGGVRKVVCRCPRPLREVRPLGDRAADDRKDTYASSGWIGGNAQTTGSGQNPRRA